MKRLLVVVNYQNDLVEGPLGFPAAKDVDRGIAAKVDQYHANHDVVAFVLDAHTRSYLGTQEGQNLPVVHCVEGTPGAEVYGLTGQARRPQDRAFPTSSFGSATFFRHLDQAQKSAAHANVQAFRSIELAGVEASTCVLSDAVLAKNACPEVPVYVDASCVASRDAKANDEALDMMAALQVIVTNRDAKCSGEGEGEEAPEAKPPAEEADASGAPESVMLDDGDIEALRRPAEHRAHKGPKVVRQGTADVTVPDGVSLSEDSTAPMKPIQTDDPTG